ncbi:MAG TPA: ArsA family ATPase [Ilumatobacteraceae bacterium]|jgi:anion-transporting  ArsA/GET3 family ATPase
MSDLTDLITAADVVVCCGSGGVGKTTTAAALGLQAARDGRRCVVVTIDPAKRLADALGVPGRLTNDPIRLPNKGPGQLWALMLDTATTFDGLVTAYARNREQASRILTNSFYRNIAGSLGGTQEYMAAERLLALHRDRRFDLVIVDTPPTRNALDFLDAPRTLARFLDHPVFKLMMMPTRRGLRVLSVAAQPLLRSIGKVIGSEVLADALAFFQAFDGMETGFRNRADEVIELLHGTTTRFVLVASPRADTIDEARFFADRLVEKDLVVGAIIVNRATPDFGAPKKPRPRRVGEAALFDNQAQLHELSVGEHEQIAPLVKDTGLEPTWVPLLPNDVHDLAALDRIRELLFAGSAAAGHSR